MHWPDYQARSEFTARLEAELLLARGALLAHEQGIDRALAWSHEQTDPFDGAALHSRVRADGVLELWSVGPNGLDEGGRSSESPTGSQDDVAVRWIRLP